MNRYLLLFILALLTSTANAQPPIGVITGIHSVCIGDTTTLHDAIPPGGTWVSSNTAVATIVAGTGLLTGVSAGTTTISYVTSSAGTASTIVTVSAAPGPISGPGSLCAGTTITLTDGTTGGRWVSVNTSVATVGSGTGVVGGVSAGVDTVVYATANTPSCRVGRLVTVNIAPSPIAGTMLLCAGTSVTLSDAAAGGTWSIAPTAVATISGTGDVYGVTAGTAVVTYSVPAVTCAAYAVVTVTPLPDIITGPTSVCEGSSITLADAVTGGFWVSTNTTIATAGSATGVVTGAVAGVVAIRYYMAPSCFASTLITVNAMPAAISGGSSLCTGMIIALSDASAGGSWSISSTTVATISAGGSVSGVSAGSATVTYSLDGCDVFATETVYATPGPITGAMTVCTGGTTTLSDGVTGGTWVSSTTSVATVAPSGTVSGVSVGTAIITYSMGGGCNIVTVVTVDAGPAAISGAASVCQGASIALTDATAGGTWSSGATSTATVDATGGLYGVAAGTVSVSYSMAGGCAATTIITVNPLPGAISGASLICVSNPSTFTDGTAGGSWSSTNTGIATVSASGVVTAVAPGTATIVYTLPTGCAAQMVVTVAVLPCSTGITALAADVVTVYPNPVDGELHVSVAAGYSTIIITNNVGQMVMDRLVTATDNVIDVHALPQGVYYVTVKGREGATVLKVVKM